MNKIWAAAAAALMATAAYAADPNASDTSSKDTGSTGSTTLKDTSSLKGTTAAKDTYDLGSTADETGANKLSGKDQLAIKGVAIGLAKAFNASDAKAATDLFAPDATVIDPMGHKAVGRVEIRQRIGDNLKGFLKGSNTVFTNITVKMVKPDVAYLDMDQQVTKTNAAEGEAGKAPPRIHATVLLLKKDGNWLIEEARPGTYVEEPPTPAS
jgi:uncharacterized protein (TIGR02246 family)